MIEEVKYKVKSRELKLKIKNLKSFVLVFSFSLFALGLGYAEPIKSNALIENAKFYDNKTITYQGEVVGDVMIRGEFAWVNINDGTGALGVWMNASSARLIGYTGAYQVRGDWIEVSGVFHRACKQHAGELDIHAKVVKKIQAGKAVTEGIDNAKKNMALILAGVLCLVAILKILQKK